MSTIEPCRVCGSEEREEAPPEYRGRAWQAAHKAGFCSPRCAGRWAQRKHEIRAAQHRERITTEVA